MITGPLQRGLFFCECIMHIFFGASFGYFFAKETHSRIIEWSKAEKRRVVYQSVKKRMQKGENA
jgi:hypothetical protein